MSNYQIPFDQDGNLLSYPENDCIFKDNFEVTLSLEFVGFERGRSSAVAIFKDTEGKRYPMFLKSLAKLINGVGIEYGVIGPARYTFVKKGANYGIEICK